MLSLQSIAVITNQPGLEALLWLIDQPVGHKRGRVARCTARIIEDLFAAQHLRVTHITPGRNAAEEGNAADGSPGGGNGPRYWFYAGWFY